MVIIFGDKGSKIYREKVILAIIPSLNASLILGLCLSKALEPTGAVCLTCTPVNDVHLSQLICKLSSQ